MNLPLPKSKISLPNSKKQDLAPKFQKARPRSEIPKSKTPLRNSKKQDLAPKFQKSKTSLCKKFRGNSKKVCAVKLHFPEKEKRETCRKAGLS